MKEEDLDFITELDNKWAWLFYGELDQILPPYIKKIFSQDLSYWGWNEEKDDEFEAVYWLILSELIRLNLAEYGTSPRGAWLTPDGERFKRIVQENPDWLRQVKAQY